MMKIIAALLCLSVAACASPEQLAEQRAAQDQADVNRCLQLGFKPNTEAFSNCRLRLDITRQERYNQQPVYYPHSHFRYNHWY